VDIQDSFYRVVLAPFEQNTAIGSGSACLTATLCTPLRRNGGPWGWGLPGSIETQPGQQREHDRTRIRIFGFSNTTSGYMQTIITPCSFLYIM
jgi:hypothetical protein